MAKSRHVSDDGHPVTIVSVRKLASEDEGEGSRWFFHEDKLRNILTCKQTQGLPISVLAIAGVKKTGKSFFMNHLKHVLMLREHPGSERDEYSNKDSGFDWKHTHEGTTRGIVMWSKPFVVSRLVDEKTGKKEQVAVFLVDTEGGHDTSDDFDDDSYIKLVTLTAFLSSSLILNIMKQIQVRDLNDLAIYSKYGLFGRDVIEGGKPFQSLTFLIRDWDYPAEHPYGEATQHINQTLFKNKLKAHRESIEKVFAETKGWYLPTPLTTVRTSPTFSGHLKDGGSQFRKNVKGLISRLVGEKTLIAKKLNGHYIDGEQLFTYFSAFVSRLEENDVPDPVNVLKDYDARYSAIILEEYIELFVQYMCAFSKRYPGASETSMMRMHQEYLKDVKPKFFSRKSFHSIEDRMRVFKELDTFTLNCVKSLIEDQKYVAMGKDKMWYRNATAVGTGVCMVAGAVLVAPIELPLLLTAGSLTIGSGFLSSFSASSWLALRQQQRRFMEDHFKKNGNNN